MVFSLQTNFNERGKKIHGREWESKAKEESGATKKIKYQKCFTKCENNEWITLHLVLVRLKQKTDHYEFRHFTRNTDRVHVTVDV